LVQKTIVFFARLFPLKFLLIIDLNQEPRLTFSRILFFFLLFFLLLYSLPVLAITALNPVA
jgi:hypothetical protein